MSTRYRIVKETKNGEVCFVPQIRHWWWPFWTGWTHYDTGGCGVRADFPRYDEARAVITQVQAMKRHENCLTVKETVFEAVS